MRCRSWSWRTSTASRAGLEGCSKAVWACRFVHTLCTPFVTNVHRHPTSDLVRRCCHRRTLLRPFLMARLTARQPLLPLLWQLRVNLYSPNLTQPTHCCARVCSLPVPAHLTGNFSLAGDVHTRVLAARALPTTHSSARHSLGSPRALTQQTCFRRRDSTEKTLRMRMSSCLRTRAPTPRHQGGLCCASACPMSRTRWRPCLACSEDAPSANTSFGLKKEPTVRSSARLTARVSSAGSCSGALSRCDGGV